MYLSTKCILNTHDKNELLRVRCCWIYVSNSQPHVEDVLDSNICWMSLLVLFYYSYDQYDHDYDHTLFTLWLIYWISSPRSGCREYVWPHFQLGCPKPTWVIVCLSLSLFCCCICLDMMSHMVILCFHLVATMLRWTTDTSQSEQCCVWRSRWRCCLPVSGLALVLKLEAGSLQTCGTGVPANALTTEVIRLVAGSPVLHVGPSLLHSTVLSLFSTVLSVKKKHT